MRWLPGNWHASGIPTTRTLLRAVYAFRVCVAFAIYLTAALKVRVAAPLDILVTSILLFTTLGVTAASYWHTHYRARRPGSTFLYLQALYDIALITTVVHMTGGPESDMAGLYVLLIAATALLMPPTSAVLITALTGLVYSADVIFGHATAVAAGTWVLFESRPAYIVFVKDRFELMRANDYPPDELARIEPAELLLAEDQRGAERPARNAQKLLHPPKKHPPPQPWLKFDPVGPVKEWTTDASGTLVGRFHGAEVALDLGDPKTRVQVTVGNNTAAPVEFRIGPEGGSPRAIGEVLLRPIDGPPGVTGPDMQPYAGLQPQVVNAGWRGTFYFNEPLGHHPYCDGACSQERASHDCVGRVV